MAEPEEIKAIEVDGSFGEGGGQIIRNGVSFACLLRQKIQVSNIRAGRPKPGLASQHLESILAMLRITGATSTSKLEKGVTEFELDASGVSKSEQTEGVYTTIDLKTAGATSLCIQCVLPYLFTLRTPSQIKIIGGTHVMKAPNFDYLETVFVPTLRKILGYDVDIKMVRPGYFPRGGGILNLLVNARSVNDNQPFRFKHFSLKEPGKPVRASAILNIYPKMHYKIPDFCQCIAEDITDIDVRTVNYVSVEYFLEYENTALGFFHLSDERHPSVGSVFRAITKVQADLKKYRNSTAAVDEFMQDQLILYMALAKLSDPNGTSEIITGPLTDHTKSAIHVSHLFLRDKYKFSVNPVDETGTTFSIKI